MKKISSLVVVAVAVLSGACAKESPERQAILDAADAMGGRQKILAVKTLTIEGEGDAPNVGQNTMPDSELPNWKVTGLKRTIDLKNHRMRMQQVRTAQFLFANANTQTQSQGLDGDIAFNTGTDGKATRASETAMKDRRLEMLHHPLVIVRAVLDDPMMKVTGFRTTGDQHVIEIETGRDEHVTLALNAATKLPSRVTSLSYNANLGDVAIDTTFSDYETVDGVQLPKHLVTKIDKYPQFDLHVTKNILDAPDAGKLEAPDSVKSASVPSSVPQITVTATPVTKGIWWLSGSGNHRSILFEFDDRLVLFEVPLNEARSKAVIDKARTISPKPLTHAIISHHHFDHSGGLRVAVAEGLTIVTYKDNDAFFKELLARKHSIVPDELALHPQEFKVVPVDDELALKDKSMELYLYHLKDNPREGTNLFGWVPKEKILVQADLYDSTWLFHHWGENVITNVEKIRKLKPGRQIPVHGEIEPYDTMVKKMRAAP